MAQNVVEELQEELKKFRDERDWKKFHTPKDLSVAITLEAAELIEHFLWKDAEEINGYVEKHRGEIADEVADVAIYLLNLCNVLDVDLTSAIRNKIRRNRERYPVKKAKGSAKKYTAYMEQV